MTYINDFGAARFSLVNHVGSTEKISHIFLSKKPVLLIELRTHSVNRASVANAAFTFWILNWSLR